MPPMNLRWTVLGRPVKPVAFTLMMTMLVLTVANLAGVGILGLHSMANFLAGVAVSTGVILFLGWWMRSQGLAEAGLLAASFVWTGRFWLALFLTDEPLIQEGTWFSLLWALVAAGSYLLERTDSSSGRGF